MEQGEFLHRIYSKVKPGVLIQKPRKMSKVLTVTPNGHIYYLIGASRRKAVTRHDLIAVYHALAENRLTNATIKGIAGRSRPCNVTTVQWILRECGLATPIPDGTWRRTW